MVHGTNAEQVRQDAEGLHTMRVLGRNMAYLLKGQEVARKAGFLCLNMRNLFLQILFANYRKRVAA